MAKRTTLTPKQAAFAGFVAGGDSYVVAYRKAYNTNGTEGTVSVASSRLAKQPLVAETIEKLRARDIRTGKMQRKVTATWVLDRLMEEAGDTANPASARIRALELLGKHQGMFIGDTDTDRTRPAGEVEEELQAKLKEFFGGGLFGTAKPVTDAPPASLDRQAETLALPSGPAGCEGPEPGAGSGEDSSD